MYYNSEIWHLPNLNPISKRHLLSASSSALKICTPTYNREMSFSELHSLNSRATPNQFLKYKHAILLFNVYNSHQPSQDWLSLNFHQILTRRQTNFEIVKSMNFKVGYNMISNRLSTLNKQIPLQWLNLSLSSYKLKCKTLFLYIFLLQLNDCDDFIIFILYYLMLW